MPFISVITVNYNNATGLKRTVESVLNQTKQNYEYIIVDGGSTDNSLAIIDPFKDRVDCIISESDDGIYDAMNKGIQRARGEYLMFLNSGDCLLNNDLFELFATQQKLNRADIFYGSIQLEQVNGERIVQSYPVTLTLEFWKDFTINHQASLISKALFSEFGFYETPYTHAADYAFFLKCFIAGKGFEYLDAEWVHYILDGKSSKEKAIYEKQRQQAWTAIVPSWANALLNEQRLYRQLQQHRLLKWASKGQEILNRLKRRF